MYDSVQVVNITPISLWLLLVIQWYIELVFMGFINHLFKSQLRVALLVSYGHGSPGILRVIVVAIPMISLMSICNWQEYTSYHIFVGGISSYRYVYFSMFGGQSHSFAAYILNEGCMSHVCCCYFPPDGSHVCWRWHAGFDQAKSEEGNKEEQVLHITVRQVCTDGRPLAAHQTWRTYKNTLVDWSKKGFTICFVWEDSYYPQQGYLSTK